MRPKTLVPRFWSEVEEKKRKGFSENPNLILCGVEGGKDGIDGEDGGTTQLCRLRITRFSSFLFFFFLFFNFKNVFFKCFDT